MDPITFEYDDFSFTLNLDASGNVVSIATPTIGPVAAGTVAFDPAQTVATAETYIEALVNLILGM